MADVMGSDSFSQGQAVHMEAYTCKNYLEYSMKF